MINKNNLKIITPQVLDVMSMLKNQNKKTKLKNNSLNKNNC